VGAVHSKAVSWVLLVENLVHLGLLYNKNKGYEKDYFTASNFLVPLMGLRNLICQLRDMLSRYISVSGDAREPLYV
jgi:hypothetical protein